MQVLNNVVFNLITNYENVGIFGIGTKLINRLGTEYAIIKGITYKIENFQGSTIYNVVESNKFAL